MSIDDMKTILVYEDKVISEKEAIKVVGEILKKESEIESWIESKPA